jgi:hypothetical protein
MDGVHDFFIHLLPSANTRFFRLDKGALMDDIRRTLDAVAIVYAHGPPSTTLAQPCPLAPSLSCSPRTRPHMRELFHHSQLTQLRPPLAAAFACAPAWTPFRRHSHNLHSRASLPTPLLHPSCVHVHARAVPPPLPSCTAAPHHPNATALTCASACTPHSFAAAAASYGRGHSCTTLGFQQCSADAALALVLFCCPTSTFPCFCGN